MNERQATKGNRDVRGYSADNRSMEPVLCPELRLAGHLQKSRRRTREMTASCLCRVLFLIAWILLLASVQASAQMDEYDIKAGYLYNFSKYVAWPDGTCQGRSKNRPLGRRKGRPVEYVEDRGLSGRRASGAEACAA
jgi:hypothetical protein